MLSPTNLFATVFEGNTKSNAIVIVDEENNTIEYIYTQSEDEVVEGVFEDIPDNAWYNEFVSILKQINVVDGVSESEFAPNREITRSEFVKLIAAIEKVELSSYGSISTFSDVSLGDWYNEYLSWAVEVGIAEGVGNDKFLGQNYISREEAIVMLYRYALSHGNGIIYSQRYNSQYGKPSFYDENEISQWAEDGVVFLATVGVISGDENGMLHPLANLTRSEAAKMIATYYLFDKKPTLINDDVALSYYGSLDYEYEVALVENTDISEEDVNFYDGIMMAEGEPYTMNGTLELLLGFDGNNRISPSWCGEQHRNLTNYALYILSEDNINNKTPKKITMLTGSTSNYKYSEAAIAYIAEGSVDPDKNETDYSMARHYYHYSYDYNAYGVPIDREGYSKDNSIVSGADYKPWKHNARWMFNDHYYNARIAFEAGNYEYAYKELGKSIHYLEDTNAPHHAALIDNASSNNGHMNYENWVKNNWYASYWETSAAGSYPFMINSSFLKISNNFSKLACDSYSDCAAYVSYPATARSATEINLKRTQRAVAGLLYRYLKDTGRDH